MSFCKTRFRYKNVKKFFKYFQILFSFGIQKKSSIRLSSIWVWSAFENSIIYKRYGIPIGILKPVNILLIKVNFFKYWYISHTKIYLKNCGLGKIYKRPSVNALTLCYTNNWKEKNHKILLGYIVYSIGSISQLILGRSLLP